MNQRTSARATREAPAAREQSAGPRREASSEQGFLGWQQAMGNRATRDVLSVVQPKLRIGAPDDRFEREADRMADTVMRMPAPDGRAEAAVSRAPVDQAQRICAECAQEEEEELLQPKAAPGGLHQPAAGLESHIGHLRGGGRPLPPSVRSFFEPRFGHDFSDVRVHSGGSAAEASQAINARAFTLGRDVAFGASEYAPETPSGRRLLAHELTHVVQQTPLVARRKPFIQRQPETPELLQESATQETREPAAEPASTPTEPASAETAAPRLIVDDEAAELSPGQMRKSDFLAEVRSGACAAADEAFAGTGNTAQGCPWLEASLRFYERQSAARVERDIMVKYVPEAAGAPAARDYIPFIAARVRESVAVWVETGEITGLPEGLPGSGLAGALSGALFSGLAGLFFKAKPGGPHGSAHPRAVQAQLGAGRPLAGSLRSRMESAFGHNFSDVRVHTGTTAVQLSNRFHARAFAVGQHMAFAAGEFQPGSLAGDALIAHELAHVVQQRGASTGARSIRSGATEKFSLERDADRSSGRAMLALFGRANGLASRAVNAAMPHQRSGLRLQRCKSKTEQRIFTGEELQDYLELLDNTDRTEKSSGSADKARQVVEKWKRGDSAYILPARLKILLIKEMLHPSPSAAGRRAILDLLRGATDNELVEVLGRVGEGALVSAFAEEEKNELEALLSARKRSIAEQPDKTKSEETFAGETIRELEKRFKSNSEAANRKNCILIVRELAPELFASDPELAKNIKESLGGLEGKEIKMTEFGRVLGDLGLVSAKEKIKFDNGNGINEPKSMSKSAWESIMSMIGNVQGWHVFGMAVFNGYHSVTVLVDNRADGPKVYWADQWRIDPGEDFYQEPGSASGFRRYEKAGFDKFINEMTNRWWNDKFAEGKRWEASLIVWKFRSRLEAASGSR